MDPMRDLPMGFGMALVKNQSAMETFSSMTPEQQQEIISRTHSVQSKEEMQSLVDSIVR
ncbi:hypothetical protein H8790_07280 [Oscillibacter hominis]|uniref:Uncharacterized protein n=1 Tax=Oscillibacter hominis TaxID=2763056 RepID=A0A7G9B8P2_9FIRM|nr:hypothetical protein [Oscillibacter hominis]QNL45923.1 hypothetical protein H8790_07280 [Oscillibacter hominis]